MGKKKRFPRPRERPFLWCTGLFAVMMLTTAAFGWRFPEQNIVFFNQTASVPVGFYVRVPDRPLARGDYVVYEMTEVTRRYAVARGYVTKPTEPFLKRVGAIAGDSYSIDAETRRFFIDGTYIGDVFVRSRSRKVHTSCPRESFCRLERAHAASTVDIQGRFRPHISLRLSFRF